MDPQQDNSQSQNSSTGKDFLKMMVLTVVCIVGAVLLVQLLQVLM